MSSRKILPVRTLAIVLGDQLDRDSLVFDQWDGQQDIVWMAEVMHESQVVPSHKVRSAVFLAAMRHFGQAIKQSGKRLDYISLGDEGNTGELGSELVRALQRHQPQRVCVVQPGEYRVQEDLKEAAFSEGYQLEVLEDQHFYCSPQQFAQHAQGRKELRLEYFYRELRKRHDILMDAGQPEGGQWNYDRENRGSFSRKGPPEHKQPRSFQNDEITKDVLRLVEDRLADNPGSLEHFDWPVNRKQARDALKDFIEYRLPQFGDFQDAMWQGDRVDPYLFHSRLSSAMNLKLLNPREVVEAAVEAYRQGQAPLAAVEGFVRQILGWREYVRGVYWLLMPQYLERNQMNAQQDLPDFYWTAETDMNCLSNTIQQTLDYGYAHHIQRLMVTGLFSLLLGVDPVQVHRWYLSVYVDAVEWVELPNTLGMSQYADGGVMASKPYVATGKYIQRMSNYCQGCRYRPDERTGESACPFTVLYWDYLSRHRKTLADQPRMALQVKNLERIDASELKQIQKQAEEIRESLPATGNY